MLNFKIFKRACFYLIFATATYFLSGCGAISHNEESGQVNSPIPDNETPTVTGYKTPQNIDLLKQELKAYYHSGGYDKAINQVGDAALQYLKSCNNMPGKLAVVFDIDEVALSNYPIEEEMDFSYNPVKADQFARSSRETVIQPTLRLFIQAQKQGIATIFLSGRKEELREATIADLKRLGYDNHAKLILRSADVKPISIADFKMKEREKLVKEGYRIILNIGDQYSDFQGGYYDKAFKYPNPFYYIP